MTTKILVMGLPGSGKTTFSQELLKRLMINHTVAWYNADIVREIYNDWDFTDAGRTRQVNRMAELAETSDTDYVICDFVCPTDDLRERFDADIVIWMDTIRQSVYEDTNKVFTPPTKWDYRITDWDKHWVKSIAEYMTNHGDSHRRSFLKAVSWRVLGTLDTVILSWLITSRVDFAVAIGGIEFLTKTSLYYIHERIWAKIKVR